MTPGGPIVRTAGVGVGVGVGVKSGTPEMKNARCIAAAGIFELLTPRGFEPRYSD